MTTGTPGRRAGTEPRNARSPLRLRTALAVFGLVACVVLAVWLVVAAGGRDGADRTVAVVLAGLAVAGALAAVVDLLVLSRRRRQAR
jgi:hypothetical protein